MAVVSVSGDGQITVGDFSLVRVGENVGRVGRMSTNGEQAWLTFGMPEYSKGAGLAQLDLNTFNLIRHDDAVTMQNVLCVLCDARSIWLGTERGLGIYHPQKRRFEELAAPKEAIFEIRAARDGGLWLGGRRRLWRRSIDGRVDEFPIQDIPEIHRIAEGKDFVVCGGDSRGGALLFYPAERRAQAIQSEALHSGAYVRDINAHGNTIAIVGSSSLQLDAVTGQVTGEQWGDGELMMATTFFLNTLVLGSIGGLVVIGNHFGRLCAEIGEVSALLPFGDFLLIAAGNDLWAMALSEGGPRTSAG